MSARALLRSETAAEHERVDALFSRFNLASANGYRGFLAAQATAFLPVEAELDRAEIQRFVPDWPVRRRSDHLRADLEQLGLTIPDAHTTNCRLDGGADLLGALYVLEGSRLGGALLKRQVPAGLPRRFLDASQPPGAWRSLLILLDKWLDRPDEARAAIGAARGVFRQFEAAALAELRTKAE